MSSIMDPARPTFPMKDIGMLTNYQNGRLDSRVLIDAGTRHLLAAIPTARKIKALTSHAVLDGIALTSTGIYRSFAQQVSLQDQRYDRGYYPGRKDYNTYQGVVYSLKVGMAGAATPGRSNHGMGRSDDFAVMANGDTIPDSLRLADKQWLAKHAPSYGIYFEVPSEDWHGTDYAGDEIPQAVLDYESGSIPIVPGFDPAHGQFSLYPLDPGKAVLRYVEQAQMNSDLVSYLQGVFRVKLGYGILVDGWFGATTRDFVIWFQTMEGLTVDGIVGRQTWAAIDRYALA